MIEALLLSLSPLSPLAAPIAPALPLVVQQHQTQDHAKAIAAAGKDVAKLMELAETWSAADEEDAANAAYERVLEIDADHEGAHKGLSHYQQDGRWFDSYKAAVDYRVEERKRLGKEGLARLGDEWVPIADVPFLRMGWTRAEDASWLRSGEAETRVQEAKYLEDGWQRMPDLTWVSPEELGNWENGLWKVGDQWVSSEEANDYHSQLDRCWTFSREHFVVRTPHTNEQANLAAWRADQTYTDLQRFFGLVPEGRPELLVVDSGLYNDLAGGNPATGQDAIDGTGWSSVHYAYFADGWLDRTTTPPSYNGMGVGLWDEESLPGFGPFAVRHAAAHSYIDAIDPSWDFISRLVTGAEPPDGTSYFWSEKKIPLWLRYGAASYVERFAEITESRDWAIEQLDKRKGPKPLAEVFTLALDPGDPDASGHLIHSAGLVVCFILDGKCKPVVKAHRGFTDALESGEDIEGAVAALQKAIVDNERQFKKFAKK